MLWRLAWPAREIRHRWRRRRGTLTLEAATIAHVLDVPVHLLERRDRPTGIVTISPLEPVDPSRWINVDALEAQMRDEFGTALWRDTLLGTSGDVATLPREAGDDEAP